MKTISTTVYTLSELSARAKAKAREWFRSGIAQDWDGSDTIEDAQQCFAHVGLDVESVHFSGFSSQGDGACFSGSWRAATVNAAALKSHAPQDRELHRIADEFARIAALYPLASFTVKQSGHYSHEHCTAFDVSIPDLEGNEIDSPAREQAEKDLIEVAKDAMRWTYKGLEKAWDWENEDEQVDENIACNGYTFTAEGKRFG